MSSSGPTPETLVDEAAIRVLVARLATEIAADHPDVVKRLVTLIEQFQATVTTGKMPPKRRFPL